MKRVQLTPIFILILIICVMVAYLLGLKYDNQRHKTTPLFNTIVVPAHAK